MSPVLAPERPPAEVPPPAVPPKPPAAAATGWRVAVSLALLLAFFLGKADLKAYLVAAFGLDGTTAGSTLGVWVAGAFLVALVLIWRRVLARDKRFHAPLLVTAVLIVGDAGFGFLETHYSPWLAALTGGWVTSYSPTFLTILAAVAVEAALGYFVTGKVPHLASAYVSGISAGILIKSPLLWPFLMCAMISITSKYVLRLDGRHLWNPTNLGVTMMLFLAPETVASLTVQAGNELLAPVVIWCLGGMILYQLGRWHMPVAFIACFVPLALLRSVATGQPFLAEVGPITSPMFQLYIFFMITDPKTTTKSRWSQILVVVLVAVAETFFRLVFRDQHSLYHALFAVGPAANLVEILYARQAQGRAAPVPAAGGNAGTRPQVGPAPVRDFVGRRKG